ncbi:TPA: hypothetical protein ACWWCX_002992 [Enterococcus faecium]
MTIQVTSDPRIIGILNVKTGEHEYFDRRIIAGDLRDANGVVSLGAYRKKKRVDELLSMRK